MKKKNTIKLFSNCDKAPLYTTIRVLVYVNVILFTGPFSVILHEHRAILYDYLKFYSINLIPILIGVRINRVNLNKKLSILFEK